MRHFHIYYIYDVNNKTLTKEHKLSKDYTYSKTEDLSQLPLSQLIKKITDIVDNNKTSLHIVDNDKVYSSEDKNEFIYFLYERELDYV